MFYSVEVLDDRIRFYCMERIRKSNINYSTGLSTGVLECMLMFTQDDNYVMVF